MTPTLPWPTDKSQCECNQYIECDCICHGKNPFLMHDQMCCDLCIKCGRRLRVGVNGNYILKDK